MEHVENEGKPREGSPRKVLVLFRKAPYGSLYNWEGLQTLLIMGAYQMQGTIQISVAFQGDGIFAIVSGQDPSSLEIKPLSKTYPALPDFEVERFYTDKRSLDERNLTLDDLVLKPELLDTEGMARLLQEQDAILPF
jgi:tRNA 2-thiouridine synthesizing protein C